MKYAWIFRHCDSFPIAVMCQVLHVSTSGYYAAVDRPASPRATRRATIRQSVRQVHAESHGIYGSHKIAQVLHTRDDLEPACRNTVAAAMREMGLASKIVKAFKPTTTRADPSRQPAENKLDPPLRGLRLRRDAPEQQGEEQSAVGDQREQQVRQGFRPHHGRLFGTVTRATASTPARRARSMTSTSRRYGRF